MLVSWILILLCNTNEVVFRTVCPVAFDEINATQKILSQIYNVEVGRLSRGGYVEKSYLEFSF